MLNYRTTLYENYYTTQAGQEISFSIKQKFTQEKNQFIREILPHIPLSKNIEILDIGCGTGSFISVLCDNEYTNCKGIDISKEQIDIAKQLGVTNVEHAELNFYLSSKELKYDVITCLDIIEHFTKDELVELLKTLKKSLNKGGMIIARTPNLDAPFASIYANGDFTHENYLNPHSAKQVFGALNYNHVKVLPSVMRADGFIKELVRKILWFKYKFFIKLLLFATSRPVRSIILTPNMIIKAIV